MLYASVPPPFRVVWPTACRCCSATARLPHFSTPRNTGRRAMARRFFFCFSGLPPRERGVLPRRGKTPLPASPRPPASRGGRKRRITLTYPPAKQENRTKPYNFGKKMGRNIPYHSRRSAFFPENAENRRAGLPGDFYLPCARWGPACSLNRPHPHSPGRRRGQQRGR